MIQEETSSSSPTFQQALRYHRQGFSVIPLLPGTKRPSVRWRHYQTIRADQEQIQTWFEKTEKNNDIAIVTGRVSCIIELDIDGEADKNTL